MQMNQLSSRLATANPDRINRALWYRHNYHKEPAWVTQMLGDPRQPYTPKPGQGFRRVK